VETGELQYIDLLVPPISVHCTVLFSRSYIASTNIVHCAFV